LRYLIQFLSLCSFVDCGFRVRVSGRVRVLLFCIFPFPYVGEKSENYGIAEFAGLENDGQSRRGGICKIGK